jgi:hypothetical protein
VHEVTGDEAPPFTVCDQLTLVAQQQPYVIAQAFEGDEHRADREKCPETTPVEMQEPEPGSGRRDNGKNPFVLS